MKLYRTHVHTHPDVIGPKPMWSGSKAEASKQRTQLCELHGLKRTQLETVEVEVPTNKVDLIDWLNRQGA